MDTDTVALFLAFLAVAAELATAAAVALTVGGRFSPALRRLRRRAVEAVSPSSLTLAAVVAAVCMGGSLYFSEVANFPPCRLCWVQRFFMYPLVPILGFAGWRVSQGLAPGWLRPLAAAMATAGGLVAAYHVALERNPQWESSVCDPANPCTLIWVEPLGYLTIPTMALSGFLLVLALLAASRAGAGVGSGGHPRTPGDSGGHPRTPGDSGGPSELPRSEIHGR